MLSPFRSRIATLVLGTALLTACGDGGEEYDASLGPITNRDASAPPVVDAGLTPDSSVSTPDATAPADTGTPKPMDATTPVPDTGVPDTGASTPDSSAADAAVDAGPVTDPDAGGGGDGTCCPDGKCLCHG